MLHVAKDIIKHFQYISQHLGPSLHLSFFLAFYWLYTLFVSTKRKIIKQDMFPLMMESVRNANWVVQKIMIPFVESIPKERKKHLAINACTRRTIAWIQTTVWRYSFYFNLISFSETLQTFYHFRIFYSIPRWMS